MPKALCMTSWQKKSSAILDKSVVELLIRTSILVSVSETEAWAVFAELERPPTKAQVRARIEDAERLGLLTRSSSSSDARQPHPLLRDFLLRQLQLRKSADKIREMNRRVALASLETDPLTAAYHFCEAGASEDAMRALGSSVWLTIGSGRWGLASELMERLTDVRPDPAVATIRARQRIEAGDVTGAEEILDGVDLSNSPPEVRAIFRQTQMTIGWRTWQRRRTFDVLADIQGDPEMPQVLQDIAAVFLDASPMAQKPGPLPDIAKRFQLMASRMVDQGLTYYSAIALHDCAVSFLNAGAYSDALDAGRPGSTAIFEAPLFRR